MQALLYLMLLCCIKIYPSMPIFNVSSWSFSVAELLQSMAAITRELWSHSRSKESILRCFPTPEELIQHIPA